MKTEKAHPNLSIVHVQWQSRNHDLVCRLLCSSFDGDGLLKRLLCGCCVVGPEDARTGTVTAGAATLDALLVTGGLDELDKTKEREGGEKVSQNVDSSLLSASEASRAPKRGVKGTNIVERLVHCC